MCVQKKAFQKCSGGLILRLVRDFLLEMGILVRLLDWKAKYFSHLFEGMPFADLSSNLSLTLGSDLEHNAKKNRVRTFRNRTGDASAPSRADVPCNEGGKL